MLLAAKTKISRSKKMLKFRSWGFSNRRIEPDFNFAVKDYFSRVEINLKNCPQTRSKTEIIIHNSQNIPRRNCGEIL